MNNETATTELALTVKEVSNIIGISIHRIRLLIKDGTIKATTRKGYKNKDIYVISKDEVDFYQNSTKVKIRILPKNIKAIEKLTGMRFEDYVNQCINEKLSQNESKR